MSELEVFAAATSRPASLLQRVDVGVLRADATADLTVLQASSSLPIGNAVGGPRVGTLWTAVLVVREGRIVVP
jgi:imidazolonepropionase-like amidohydrolase